MNHLIYFYSAPDPRMIIWKENEISDSELSGDLNINFSFEKKCIGYQNENARFKCPEKNHGIKQCIFCSYKDISKVYTRLDFTGYEHIREQISKEKFSIYLALFGDSLVKCGVTHAERVETRTMEQGADFWVELMQFDNAEDAYTMEQNLQNTFGFRNAIYMDTKIKIALAGKFDSKKLEDAIEQVALSKDFSNNLYSKTVRKLHYCTPRDFKISNNIDGEIICSKASLLFFKKDGDYFCTNMKKNEGCEFLYYP